MKFTAILMTAEPKNWKNQIDRYDVTKRFSSKIEKMESSQKSL